MEEMKKKDREDNLANLQDRLEVFSFFFSQLTRI